MYLRVIERDNIAFIKNKTTNKVLPAEKFKIAKYLL